MKIFNLAQVIMRKYPEAIPDENFLVEYDPFTEESTIIMWKLPYPKPSEAEALEFANVIMLEQAQGKKEAELKEACEKAILSGFDHTINGVVYHFSYDDKAQMNFLGASSLLGSGKKPSIPWTAYKVATGERVRIDVDRPLMEKLEVAQFDHKNTHTVRYNYLLLSKVYPAKSVQEVEAVRWND